MRRSVALLLTSLVVVACGGDDGSGPATTLSSLAPTTTAEVAVTEAPTTTAAALTEPADSAVPTTTAAPTTTTTLPLGAELVIAPDRLGDAIVGTSAESVIDYVDGVLGPASEDAGWQDVRDIGAPCPGDEVRFVTWGDGLTLFFTDSGAAATGFRHFAGFTYAESPTMSPAGPATSAGITLGSSLDAVEAAHPGTVAYADDVFGTSAETPEGIVLRLTGTGGDDRVTSISVGSNCGE